MISMDQWYKLNSSLLGLIYWCAGASRALQYVHVLMKALILIFFFFYLLWPQCVCARDKAPTIFNLRFLYGTNLHQLCCPPLSPSMGAVSTHREDSWHAVLIWTVLILSAWRLIAGADTKLVMHAVPSFDWSDNTTRVCRKTTTNRAGHVRTIDQPHLRPVFVCVSEVPVTFCPASVTVHELVQRCTVSLNKREVKMGDMSHNSKNEQLQKKCTHHPQWSRCPAVCVCVLECMHTPKRPSLSPNLPCPSSFFLLEYQWVTSDTNTW